MTRKEMAFDEFPNNLELVKEKINPELYNYLKGCDTIEDIELAIVSALEKEYIMELDWLYSTFHTFNRHIEIRNIHIN